MKTSGPATSLSNRAERLAAGRGSSSVAAEPGGGGGTRNCRVFEAAVVERPTHQGTDGSRTRPIGASLPASEAGSQTGLRLDRDLVVGAPGLVAAGDAGVGDGVDQRPCDERDARSTVRGLAPGAVEANSSPSGRSCSRAGRGGRAFHHRSASIQVSPFSATRTSKRLIRP